MLKESKLKKNLEHIRLSHLVSSYAVALLMQLFTTYHQYSWSVERQADDSGIALFFEARVGLRAIVNDAFSAAKLSLF